MAWPLYAIQAAGMGMKSFSDWLNSRAQAQQAREDANRARMTGSMVRESGVQAAGKIDLGVDARIAKQEVAYSHSGVDLASGSLAKVIAQTKMVGALDAATTVNNAFRSAWGYDMHASDLERFANREDQAAQWNLFAAIFPIAGQIVQGSSGGQSDTGAPDNTWEMSDEDQTQRGDGVANDTVENAEPGG